MYTLGRMPFILIALTLLVMAVPVRAQHQIDPTAVKEAIDKARAWLLEQQKNGTWENIGAPRVNEMLRGDEDGNQWGGRTALTTYALLATGERPTNPKLQQAIAFLRRANITGIYALGMRAQVWYYLPSSPENKAAVARDAKLLMAAMKIAGTARGFYDYNQNNTPRFDHSVSQYGVLGMWTLTQAGFNTPHDYWRTVNTAWRGTQQADGGWSYRFEGNENITTPAMTSAGLATLFIAQDYLRQTARGADKNIESGVKWMAKHMNEMPDEWRYYTWYGIERAAVAGGLKYFGDRDWYLEGAREILQKQNYDGHWDNDIPSTSLALLFLHRGLAPIAFNKLRYGTAGGSGWNQRPRDVANLTRFVSKETERALNWQIVDLTHKVEDLQDAPVLCMTGNQAFTFTDPEKSALRKFIHRGGLVFASADGGSPAFGAAFRKLGTDIFPYEFVELHESHPIYTSAQFDRKKWATKPSVVGMSNGSRLLMVLVPHADPGRAWSMSDPRIAPELWQLAANVYAYSEDKQRARYRGDTYLVPFRPEIQATATVKIARIQYGQNPDPEPAGWERLAAVLHNDHKLDLEITTVKPGEGKLASNVLAHFTGTTAFIFNDPARKEIKDFVNAGGTLLLDATGGAAEFAKSAEEELSAIFGDIAPKQLAEPLPPDHPLYASGDTPLQSVAYRNFARKYLVGKVTVPRLRGITINNRLAVIFSPEDLSTGMVGMPMDGINGYDPASATALMTRIILTVSPKAGS